MRNFSQGQSTDTKSLILESSEGIASSSLRSNGRGAFHTTSFHFVVKDSLSEWKQLELKHNTLKITELEYFYDINESRIRGGYGESSDISKICQKIKKRTRVHGWKSIKGFNLEISGNNMFPNSKIRELSEGLSRSMIKPQHFTLDYRSSLIEEKELNNLSKAIGRYLASLHALKLQFRYDGRREVLGITKPIDQNYECKNVTDTTLQGLGRNLRRYLNNLTVLDLKFANCTQISDKGLLQIGSTIHTSRFNLIQLSLDFSRCSQITDEGVEKFLSHISKNSKKLKHLDLNFSNCTSIGIRSLKEDSLDLEHDLNSLEELELNFESCVMMRDEYVQFLASQFLPKFTHLKELKLSLDGCESITDESVKALLSVNYNQLFDLQKLTLNL